MTDRAARRTWPRWRQQPRGPARSACERIGDTLTSTHDLDGLLQVVLETAVVTLQARGRRRALRTHRRPAAAGGRAAGCTRPGWSAPAGMTPGVGVLGRVVDLRRGRARSARARDPPELEPAPTEPGCGRHLAVPLRSMGNVIGVLALYDRIDGRPFDERGRGRPAHPRRARPASRSTTCSCTRRRSGCRPPTPLTGLWNFRYLSMSLAREIERVHPVRAAARRADARPRPLQAGQRPARARARRHRAARAGAPGAGADPRGRHVRPLRRRGVRRGAARRPRSRAPPSWPSASASPCAASRSAHEGEEPLDVTVSVGGAAFPDARLERRRP